MTHWEMIDAFILDKCPAIGSTFQRSDVWEWFKERGYVDVDPGSALQAHRQNPDKRVFTTKRVGMGPSSHYEVVETAKGVRGKAVREMHRQQSQEALDRWLKEAIFRMYPLAARNKAAMRHIKRAQAEMHLVAAVLQSRLDELDLGDDE